MRSWQLVLCSVCVVLGWLGAAARTRALESEPPVLELIWDAPPECPDAMAVRAQADALVRNDGRAKRGLKAEAHVTRADDGRWLLQLQLLEDGVVDQRELVGDSCQALVDSVAVILAMQLNSTESQAMPPAAPPRAAEPVPTPAPPPKPTLARSEQRKLFAVQLGLAGSVDSAALPRLSLGGRADLGVTFDRFYLGASASAWLDQEKSLQQGHAGRARFGWRAASLWACHATWGQGVRVGPCLAAELGQLSARSSGVRAPAQVYELWLAGLGGFAFWVPLGSRLLLTSNVAAVVPLRRPSFVIEGIGEIHQPRVVGGRSALGLAWRF